MKSTVFYTKNGRKYTPVKEYDNELMSSFPCGTTLVVVKPGGTSYRHQINPGLAPLIAAGVYAKDSIINAIQKAAEMNPYRSSPFTDEQNAAWDALAATLGERRCMVQWDSLENIAQAGVQALIDEASTLLDDPFVRDAYEQFLTAVELKRKTAV